MTIITAQEHHQDLSNIFDHEDLRHVPKIGIVHVGANIGQEVPQYRQYGFKKIILIEANPEPYKILESKFGGDPDIRLFNYAICDQEGMVDFHIHTSRSGNTEPASILQMGRFKDIVKTLHTTGTIQIPSITLDALFKKYQIAPSDYNFINIDIQGAELLALKSSTTIFPSIDVIVSEVNLLEMYESGALEHEIVDYLDQHGYEKRHAVYHPLYDETSTFPAWGECLFVKRTPPR